jgi:hypothetical protein
MKSIKKEFKDRIEYQNEQGLLHRLDGPARIWHDGSQSWWINDNLHREDGPAREWNDGDKEWFLNNILYTKTEWEQEVNKIKLKRILDL